MTEQLVCYCCGQTYNKTTFYWTMYCPKCDSRTMKQRLMKVYNGDGKPPKTDSPLMEKIYASLRWDMCHDCIHLEYKDKQGKEQYCNGYNKKLQEDLVTRCCTLYYKKTGSEKDEV